MSINHTLVYICMLILNFIVLSLQFECLPNGAPIPGVLRGDPSSSAPDTRNPPVRPHPSNSSSSHAEHPLRSRSRSRPAVNETLPTIFPPSKVLGYGIDQLEFIRLFPYKNMQRHFEFRKYAFPVDKKIEFLGKPHKYEPMPTQEQIVLSTPDADVFAILDGADTLTGIYTYNPSVYYNVRAKINMNNGEVTLLTADEIEETPVGRNRQILYGYRVEHLNRKHGSIAPDKQALGTRASSSLRHMAPPTKLPSCDGSGYEIDQLPFIRFIPMRNSNQIFELRRYTLPADKLILSLEKRHHYGPVPVRELIVLTTYSGDVLAILESSNALAGIYTYNSSTGIKGRVKINMQSGRVSQLTRREMEEVPVGHRRPILNNFGIQHVQHNPSRHLINQKESHT